jgi:hypothetical protein
VVVHRDSSVLPTGFSVGLGTAGVRTSGNPKKARSHGWIGREAGRSLFAKGCLSFLSKLATRSVALAKVKPGRAGVRMSGVQRYGIPADPLLLLNLGVIVLRRFLTSIGS